MRARHRAPATAAVAFALALLVGAIGPAAGSQRTLSLYNIHTKETLTAVYKRNGRYVPEEMKKINWILRDWRKDEATTMDPELIDLLWEVHTELGSKEPIHVISGYRSRKTNEMLRRTRGGQAKRSRHILGMAADVHFPDVPLRLLRYSALIREKGGVGYYPTSAIPFVHLDVDRARSWPRLPRAELALLFPRGHTKHLPQDGRPITPADVRAARANNSALAVQVAEFYAHRGAKRPVQTAAQPKPPVQTAALTPSLPQLLRPPKLVQRPPPWTTHVSDAARAKLAALAAETPPPPRLRAPPALAERPASARVVAAPEYDEEHPEELSYRPFPIAPLLTATASVHDPALAVMTHPDLDKVLELLEHEETVPPMRLRPGIYEAERMWAAQSKGVALDLSVLNDANAATRSPQHESRKVATQAR